MRRIITIIVINKNILNLDTHCCTNSSVTVGVGNRNCLRALSEVIHDNTNVLIAAGRSRKRCPRRFVRVALLCCTNTGFTRFLLFYALHKYHSIGLTSQYPYLHCSNKSVLQLSERFSSPKVTYDALLCNFFKTSGILDHGSKNYHFLLLLDFLFCTVHHF